MRHYVAMSIYLAAAFAIVMTIGLEALNEPILRLMNSPEELMGSVKGYMGIIYAGLIVTAAYNSWRLSCVHWEIPNRHCIF